MLYLSWKLLLSRRFSCGSKRRKPLTQQTGDLEHKLRSKTGISDITRLAGGVPTLLISPSVPQEADPFHRHCSHLWKWPTAAWVGWRGERSQQTLGWISRARWTWRKWTQELIFRASWEKPPPTPHPCVANGSLRWNIPGQISIWIKQR